MHAHYLTLLRNQRILPGYFVLITPLMWYAGPRTATDGFGRRKVATARGLGFTIPLCLKFMAKMMIQQPKGWGCTPHFCLNMWLLFFCWSTDKWSCTFSSCFGSDYNNLIADLFVNGRLQGKSQYLSGFISFSSLGIQNIVTSNYYYNILWFTSKIIHILTILTKAYP